MRLLLRAGAELGLLNFLGTACQAWGLEQTTATRAGFLLSTINVGVPLFAAAGLGGRERAAGDGTRVGRLRPGLTRCFDHRLLTGPVGCSTR